MIHFTRKHMMIVVIIAIVLIGIFVLRQHGIKEAEKDLAMSEPLLLTEEKEMIDTETTNIMVDIKGEVKNPGVYEVEQGTRVVDIIEKAGGFTEFAVENEINLAQKVFDEMVLVVPKEGEIVLSSAAESGSSEKLRINQATKEEIEQLNGIGPKKAQAIIDYREENGLFQQIDDLLEVNGIGEKTLENFKDAIIVP